MSGESTNSGSFIAGSLFFDFDFDEKSVFFILDNVYLKKPINPDSFNPLEFSSSSASLSS
jgi:hypothetical protein